MTELQSVGTELIIFVITLSIALLLRKTSFTKPKKCQKVMKSCEAKETATQPIPSGNASNSPSKKPARVLKAPDMKASGSSAWQVDAIMNHASKRQAADAIFTYEALRADSGIRGMEAAMRNSTHRPLDVFSMLVQCAGRVGRPDMIISFLDDMEAASISRSLGFYESAMKLLASKKCYREALSVCSHLEADGLEPSPTTLSCLINFAVEIGDAHRAIDFFTRLSASSTPSIRAYMTILRVYSRQQNWHKSLSVIRDMQQCEAPIDSLVVNVVLATGVAAGQIKAAKELLHEFLTLKIVDVVSFNTVIKGFAQQKDADGALGLLKEMCKAGLKPNAITFNTVMDAAVRSQRVADAWQVLTQMRRAGVTPDKFTCTTLSKGLQDGASLEQLTTILDLLGNVTAQCDPSLCSSLLRSVIEAAAKVNDVKLTEKATEKMREHRSMLQAHEYQRLSQLLMHDCKSVN